MTRNAECVISSDCRFCLSKRGFDSTQLALADSASYSSSSVGEGESESKRKRKEKEREKGVASVPYNGEARVCVFARATVFGSINESMELSVDACQPACKHRPLLFSLFFLLLSPFSSSFGFLFLFPCVGRYKRSFTSSRAFSGTQINSLSL